jgi:hypothetical protein
MILSRFAQLEKETIGRLDYDGESYWTVERPWLNNLPFESCIPDGNYVLRRCNSPKFGPNMWEVADVPGRSHILIHVANTSRDVVGCIGLGESLYGDLSGVGSSRKAIAAFYDKTAGLDEIELTIVTKVLK